MAIAANTVNRSDFVRNFLKKNPNGKYADCLKCWNNKEASKDIKISRILFDQVCRGIRLKAKKASVAVTVASEPIERSSFIRNKLKSNPQATYNDIVAEWEKLPNPLNLKIQKGLYSFVKSDLKSKMSTPVLDKTKQQYNSRTNLMIFENYLDSFVSNGVKHSPKIIESIRNLRREVGKEILKIDQKIER